MSETELIVRAFLAALMPGLTLSAYGFTIWAVITAVIAMGVLWT
jgi:hypothetical protein